MKDSLKEILRNNKIIIIVAIIIPIIVHVLYSVYIFDGLSSKWTAGEMLMYFGTIFSVVVAIKGIFNSLNMHFKDNINSVKPYIAIESLNILRIRIYLTMIPIAINTKKYMRSL